MPSSFHAIVDDAVRESMVVCRFLFGVGEAGVLPVATRSLSQWMLPSERGRKA